MSWTFTADPRIIDSQSQSGGSPPDIRLSLAADQVAQIFTPKQTYWANTIKLWLIRDSVSSIIGNMIVGIKLLDPDTYLPKGSFLATGTLDGNGLPYEPAGYNTVPISGLLLQGGVTYAIVITVPNIVSGYCYFYGITNMAVYNGYVITTSNDWEDYNEYDDTNIVFFILSGAPSVTLPDPPMNLIDDNPIIDSSFEIGGQQSLVVSEGLDVRVLTLKGFLHVNGQTQAYLDTNYALPLLAQNRQVVTLSCPISRFNGNWLFSLKQLEQRPEGSLARYIYTIVLKQGAGFVVL
jgi:hypothetical protein